MRAAERNGNERKKLKRYGRRKKNEKKTSVIA